MALPAPRAERMSLLIARTAAFFAALIGALILFVWQLPIPQLTQSFPGLLSLTPAAAGGIVAGAVGLFCLTFRAIRPLARLIGFALVVLGLAILSQDLLGFNLGLDQALTALLEEEAIEFVKHRKELKQEPEQMVSDTEGV